MGKSHRSNSLTAQVGQQSYLLTLVLEQRYKAVTFLKRKLKELTAERSAGRGADEYCEEFKVHGGCDSSVAYEMMNKIQNAKKMPWRMESILTANRRLL